MTRSAALVFASVLAMSACGTPDKGEESTPLDSLDATEKADSLTKPTDHGVLPLSVAATATLTASAGFHAWSFSLPGTGSVRLVTQASSGHSVDTVLYLYKKGPTGWGRYIARNDDASSSTVLSAVDKELDSGVYRVVVKGYKSSDRGKLGLLVTCAGAGCAAAPSCLFGATFGDLAGINGLIVGSHQTFTSAAGFSDMDKQQAILALHASTHTDVTTIEEAFAAADEGKLNKISIYDPAGARSFTAWEYGAGDNSYGAIFAAGTTTEVAEDHDTDIIACTVKPDSCLFGSTYNDAKNSGAFTLVSEVVITAKSALTTLGKSQLIRAVQESNPAVTTVAEAFDNVDQNEVNVVQLTHKASGKKFTAYEFGAGDNSYGALFNYGTATEAAAIHDGDLYSCTAF